MAFKTNREIDQKTLERVEIIQSEIMRLYMLTDRFLGRALLKIGREARAYAPDALGNPAAGGYDVILAWGVIPRLASRLGENDLLPAEEAFARSLTADAAEFRTLVGSCMNNSSLRLLVAETDSLPLSLLNREFVNGNPITMALDRVHPPTPESADWCARHMREISWNRFGHGEHDAWSPEFQNFEGMTARLQLMAEPLPDPDDGLEP